MDSNAQFALVICQFLTCFASSLPFTPTNDTTPLGSPIHESTPKQEYGESTPKQEYGDSDEDTNGEVPVHRSGYTSDDDDDIEDGNGGKFKIIGRFFFHVWTKTKTEKLSFLRKLSF